MKLISLENLPRLLLWAVVVPGALVACAGCPHDTVKSATAEARTEITAAQASNADAKAKAVDADKHIETARARLKAVVAIAGATSAQLIDAINATLSELDAASTDVKAIQNDTASTDTHLQHTAPALNKADAAADKQQSIINNITKFHGVEIAAFVIIGLSIAAGVYFGNLRVGAAGAAGGLIVLLVALNLGEIAHIARWIGGLFALACAAAVAYEIYDHGGLSPALFKTAHDEAKAVLDAAKSKAAEVKAAV